MLEGSTWEGLLGAGQLLFLDPGAGDTGVFSCGVTEATHV